jgi:hypothetical protein
VPPVGPLDRRKVAAELARVHSATNLWPQRPRFRTARELLRAERGGDVRLDAMPAQAVAFCRSA